MWNHHRRLITPAFHFGILSKFADVMAWKAEIMSDIIKGKFQENPNSPVNIFPLAIKCTLDTFCETSMGIDDDMQRQDDNPYVDAVRR